MYFHAYQVCWLKKNVAYPMGAQLLHVQWFYNISDIEQTNVNGQH